MMPNGYLQLALYIVVLLALAKPLGAYMARVYEGKRLALERVLGWLERLIYRICGVTPTVEMGWKGYAVAMMLFNLVGLIVVYLLQRFQGGLPLNPQGFGAVSADSSFNTAVSFVTNTNWQGYGGETTMSYLTQMLGLTVQNFVSAAAGMAMLAALIRGLARRSAQTIGNFWVDLTRTTLYILLPLVVRAAPSSSSPRAWCRPSGPMKRPRVLQPVEYDEPVTDDQGKPVLDDKGQPKTKKTKLTEQVIAVGPAASQIAIKQLGTNGGGFFNVNSAHPFENPTPLSNFLELLAILLISAALCYTFGVMVKRHAAGLGGPGRHDRPLRRAPRRVRLGRAARQPLRLARRRSRGQRPPGRRQHGGQGDPLRHRQLGPVGDGHHRRLQRLGQLHARFLYAARRPRAHVADAAWRGGVRRRRLGLYGMLVFAIVAVFIAGLMVGRTPEYLGKKIEAFEMKMASLVILIPPAVVLIGHRRRPWWHARRQGQRSSIPAPTASARCCTPSRRPATTTAAPSPGSAPTRRSTTRPWASRCSSRRFWLGFPFWPSPGRWPGRRSCRPVAGTLPTHTPLFVVLLVGVVIIVGALTFIPALALGPIVEHLHMVGREVEGERRPRQSMGHEQWLEQQEAARCSIAPIVRPGDPSTRSASSTRGTRSAIPVMFVVVRGQSILTTCSGCMRSSARARRRPGSSSGVSVWLWFTVLFANFAEAMAEGRGKAQADSPAQGPPRCARPRSWPPPQRGAAVTAGRPATSTLRKGDVVWSKPATSSRPTARSSRASPPSTRAPSRAKARRSSARAAATAARVTGGTLVLSDWLIVRVTANPGETFLDRMIALVEGAKRQKTPNEIALDILLAGADDHLPAGHGHAAAVLALQRAGGGPGHAGHGHRARGAARLPDSHHHRRRCSPRSASRAWTA